MHSRHVTFAVLAALILLGPAYGHFFATGDLAYVGWKMFSRTGFDVCVVDYRRGGERLDRFALLKGQKPRVRSAQEARAIARDLCKATGQEVRAQVRCASPRGWDVALAGDRDLCKR